MAKRAKEKPASGRTHRATYSTDKRTGGYLIRVEGPSCNRFAGRTVPVTRRDGSESDEKLERLIWTGQDKETGEPVSLYKFAPKPKEDEALNDEIPF